jgi:hypothetical protein
MKSAASTLRRLLRALEDLGRHEDGALAGGDGVAFLALEDRARPLVLRIVALVSGPDRIDAELVERGRALVDSRRERRRLLMRVLETTRDEIGRLDEARARARVLRPAYAASRGRACGVGALTAHA